jgi:Uma2 family endonuclease
MNTIEQTIADNPSAVLAAIANVLPEIIEKNGMQTNGETQLKGKTTPKLIDPEKQIEIVDGKLEIKEMPGLRSSGTAMRIAVKMGIYLENNRIGELYGADATFTIGKDERMPDLSFVSNEKLKDGEPITKADFAPDLAVEVVSPTDAYSKVLKKIRKYLDAGVKQVWLVEPEFQTITIYTPPMKSETLSVEDTLICEEILPNFRLSLKEIFRQPK